MELATLSQTHPRRRRSRPPKMQTRIFASEDRWEVVKRCDPRARELADRHYSRQTVGAVDFLPCGRTLVLLTTCALAVWGVVENLDPAGQLRWRCSIFRNEGAGLSSDLIREATTRTYLWWLNHYGRLPKVPLTTEVDPRKTRKKRDPGRCFRRAGWRVVDMRRGLVVLQAPIERARSIDNNDRVRAQH